MRILTTVGAAAVVLYYTFARRCLSGYFAMYLAFVLSPIFMIGPDGSRLRVVPAIVVDGLAALAITVSSLVTVRADFSFAAVLLMAAALVLYAGRVVWRLSSSTRRFDGGLNAGEVLAEVMDIFYLTALVFLLCVGKAIGGHDGWGQAAGAVVCVALLCALVAALHRRREDNKVFLIFKKRNNRMNEARRMKKYETVAGIKLSPSYESLFIRVREYFETESPYLDPNMTIVQVANILLTNKQYLSFTINAYTGKNFCQFANYYRIKHFIKMYRSDSSRKISQLAMESGFRTLHSFNMAFRLNMNIAPSQWCRANKVSK
ncbi:MAG: helix-turn-helix domain-containing protein [Bacteroidales bacterium]|nr:helix-turn-helix domain-containing protein [Bacteroidales bacterium]